MAIPAKRRRRTQAELAAARVRREANRKRNLRARHGMSPEQYDRLLAFQGGACYICQRARGGVRALAVDHDHALAREACAHPHDQSCPACWRGLLCARCNDMLGHARDDAAVFYQAIDYLANPPAPRCFRPEAA